VTSNSEDISSFLAVRKHQMDRSSSFNKKVLLGLGFAALVVVATIAMIYSSGSKEEDIFEDIHDAAKLEVDNGTTAPIAQGGAASALFYAKGTKKCSGA